MPADDSLRADARVNRDRILDVARDALAANPAASLNSVAKAAGVGAGTLYRHFPSREALVLAVYRKEIGSIAGLAAKLLAKHQPLQAFRLWCDRLAKFGRVKFGMADALHSVLSDQDHRETYEPMLEAVRQLMAACERSGEIRAGVDPEDVLTLLGLLWRIPPDATGEARVKRILTLVFRGLGAGAIGGGENTLK